MPQEAWILKCYLCKKFQVQLTKKAKKWKCTVCGSKQDLMTIFFKGSPSDCRVNVQNMNAAEGEKLEKLQQQSCYFDENDAEDYVEGPEDPDFDNLMHDQIDEFAEACVEEADEWEEAEELEELFTKEDERSFLKGSTQEYSSSRNNSQDDRTNSELSTHSNENHKLEDGKENKFPDFVSAKVLSNSQTQNSNIFESNYDIDESLDF